MSKTWISLSIISLLLILAAFYALFYSKPNTPFISASKDYLANWYEQPRLSNDTNSSMEITMKEINWKEIPRKPSPPKGEMHEKWIVVTTINSPTADVKKLAGIEGWKVVVVGDTKTPTKWRLDLELDVFKLIFPT